MGFGETVKTSERQVRRRFYSNRIGKHAAHRKIAENVVFWDGLTVSNPAILGFGGEF